MIDKKVLEKIARLMMQQYYDGCQIMKGPSLKGKDFRIAF